MNKSHFIRKDLNLVIIKKSKKVLENVFFKIIWLIVKTIIILIEIKIKYKKEVHNINNRFLKL